MRRVALLLLCCAGFAIGARAQAPCCSVTAINAATGIVSAKVNANGEAFQFKIANANLLKELRIGAAVYANFTTREVSLDGRTIAGPITSGPQAPARAPAAPVPAPAPKPAIPQTAVPVARPAPVELPPAAGATPPKPATPSTETTPAVQSALASHTNETALKPGLIAQAPGLNLQPWYLQRSFQLCCKFIIEGVLGSTGPAWPVTVNSQFVSADSPTGFIVAPIPSYKWPQNPGVQSGVPTPLYVNLWTHQASIDGTTACCTITSGTPINETEPVYLDILPIGVIYVPPGDPRATGSSVPHQAFTSAIANQTSVTKVTSKTTGTTNGLSGSIPGIAISATSSQSTQNQTQYLHQASLSVQDTAQAVGPGNYPGQGDILSVWVNPVFDVTYLGAYSYSSKIPPIPTNPEIISITPHVPKSGDPGYPQKEWEPCTFSVQVLQIGGASATCLRDILAAPPQAAVPVNPISGAIGPVTEPLTAAQRLLQLDPMAPPPNTLRTPVVAASVLSTIALNGSQAAPPASITNSNGRFTQPWGAGGFPWTYCQDPSPIALTAINSQVDTTQNIAATKFTSSTTLTLNPVQAIQAVAGAVSGGGGDGGDSGSGGGNGGGGGGGGVSAFVSFGDTWELDTTTTTQAQKTVTLTTAATFGGGMTPSLSSPTYTWLPSTSYPNVSIANGNFILPTVDNTFEYTVKTPGISGTTEPTWCNTAGCAVKDGTVVWTLYGNTCESLPEFLTSLYYDQTSDTVLFWTTQDTTASPLVKGRAESTHPGKQSVVFTPVGGGHELTVFTDATGQFSLKLPPGNYTYRVVGSTAAPVPVTVPPNQTRTLQLPEIKISGD
jgi:hypothetical protein